MIETISQLQTPFKSSVKRMNVITHVLGTPILFKNVSSQLPAKSLWE